MEKSRNPTKEERGGKIGKGRKERELETCIEPFRKRITSGDNGGRV